MMDGNDDENNNNDDEDHHDQNQQQVVDEDNEEEEVGDDEGDSDDESTVAADTMLVRANRRDKLQSLLDQYNACPSRTRNNIDDLVAEALEKAEDDVHEMLCDQNADPDIYRGLDIKRDTIEEVETIVRFFPNTLSKRKETKWGDDEEGVEGWINAEDGEGHYPIQCLLDLYGPNGWSFNFKALPFVATVAQLGKDLDQFEDEERGGLLIEDEHGDNTLQYLALISHSSNEEELNRRMDIVCLSQLIQLRRMDLFMEEDIQRYDMVHYLCCQDYFAENTFQFLVEWDPSSLLHADEDGCLPLHYAAWATIQAFRIVFEYVIRYYPHKKGITILFTKNNWGMTPFQQACEKYGKEVVITVIEDTLNNSVIPLTIAEAVVMAADDENIHLDCSYFLLRREPDVLVQLLSVPHNNNNNNDDGGGGGGGEDDHDNDGDTVDDDDDDDDDDNDGGYVDNDNHDEEDDDDKDEGGEVDESSEDSTNNGIGTRKRKRAGGSIDDGG